MQAFYLMRLEEELEGLMMSSYDESLQFEMPLMKVKMNCDDDDETNQIEVLEMRVMKEV